MPSNHLEYAYAVHAHCYYYIFLWLLLLPEWCCCCCYCCCCSITHLIQLPCTSVSVYNLNQFLVRVIVCVCICVCVCVYVCLSFYHGIYVKDTQITNHRDDFGEKGKKKFPHIQLRIKVNFSWNISIHHLWTVVFAWIVNDIKHLLWSSPSCKQ